jgi:O-antigen/teichoic acid export membrane protein
MVMVSQNKKWYRIQQLRQQIREKINANQHIKEIVHGAGIIFAAKVLAILAGLGTNLLIARYYGTEMVGVVAIINAVLAICMIFSLMGTDVAALRFIPEYLQKYSSASLVALQKKLIIIVVLLSAIMTAVLFLASPFVSSVFLNDPDMQKYIVLAACFILVQSLATLNMETIRGFQSMRIYACMQSMPYVLNFILLGIMSLFCLKESNPIYALFVAIFVTSLALLFFALRLPRKRKTTVQREHQPSYRTITTLALPMFLTSVIFVVIYQSDTLMLGALRTEAEVGIYTIALKLAVLSNFILISVNSTAAPKFSQIYHDGDLEELKVVAQGSTRIAFWIIMPILLFSLAFGRQILGLFGEEFTVGYSVLVILLVGQSVNVGAGAVGLFLDMTGHEKVFRNIVVFAGGLNILLNMILIPRYHMNGAAVASMVSIIMWNVLASRYIKKNLVFPSPMSHGPIGRTEKR